MFRRALEAAVLTALTDRPVVLLTGARQAGKSTLVSQLRERRALDAAVTLDDLPVLAAARADPVAFVANLPPRAAIDEIQRAPDLLLAVKAAVDRDRRPGRFLLTGSADVLTLPTVAESLAGRMESATLWPLCQAEIEGAAGDFVTRAFAEPGPNLQASVGPGDLADIADPADVTARVLRGGYPEIVDRIAPARRASWFDAYVTSVLSRDVRDISQVADLAALPRLLALVAARSAALANFSELARSLGTPLTTLRRHRALLQSTFLLYELPAWHENLGKRLVKAPKLFVADSGLAAHLMGEDHAALTRDQARLGSLLESFVVMELMRLASFASPRARLYHFRSHDGVEVDALLEDRKGRLVAIEVKATATPKESHFRGLRALAKLVPGRFHRGLLLHLGDQTLPFGDRLWAAPVSTLWT